MSELREKIDQYITGTCHAVPKHPWRQYPEYTTYEDPESGKWFALYMPIPADRLIPGASGICDVLNLKAEPDFIMMIAGQDGIYPAYHMNKQHWISVLLDGNVPFRQLCSYIDTSFRLVTDTPSKRIYEAVKRIPCGRVATYGQIAAMAGNPRMSRAVGNALHHNPDEQHIPCYRVVNAKGELSGSFAFGGPEEQANRLRADGIEVVDGRVDLEKYQYRWTPEDE